MPEAVSAAPGRGAKGESAAAAPATVVVFKNWRRETGGEFM